MGVIGQDMSQSSQKDRVSVKTYIPQYQKTEWESHADEMEMSISEFIRTMVQSGRQPYDVETSADIDATPGVDGIENAIIDIIEDGGATWDELRDAVVGDIEATVEETLTELQQSGSVIYNGRSERYERIDNGE